VQYAATLNRRTHAQVHHRTRVAGDRQRGAAGAARGCAKVDATLKELGPDIQWVESYVANDKTFCVYLARDEEIIREHAKRSGFPANKITEVRRMIDPTTATEQH